MPCGRDGGYRTLSCDFTEAFAMLQAAAMAKKVVAKPIRAVPAMNFTARTIGGACRLSFGAVVEFLFMLISCLIRGHRVQCPLFRYLLDFGSISGIISYFF